MAAKLVRGLAEPDEVPGFPVLAQKERIGFGGVREPLALRVPAELLAHRGRDVADQGNDRGAAAHVDVGEGLLAGAQRVDEVLAVQRRRFRFVHVEPLDRGPRSPLALLGVELHPDPVHEQGRVRTVERRPVRPVVRADRGVVAHARRASAEAVGVDDVALVAQHETGILVGGLMHLGQVADDPALADVRPGRRHGERRVDAHDLVHAVEAVHAVVGDDAVRIVHEVPVAEPVGVEGDLGRRAQPEVPVEPGGHGRVRPRSGVALVAIVPDAHEIDGADLPALHEPRRVRIVVSRTVLGTDLDDALVPAHGVANRGGLADAVHHGLLEIDVLAGFAGQDGDGRVPVVGGGQDDRVDLLRVEKLAEVGVAGRLRREPPGHGDPLLEDVAQGRDLDVPRQVAEPRIGSSVTIALGRRGLDVLRGPADQPGHEAAPPTTADQAKVDAIVRSDDAGLREGRQRSRGRGLQKHPSLHRSLHGPKPRALPASGCLRGYRRTSLRGRPYWRARRWNSTRVRGAAMAFSIRAVSK